MANEASALSLFYYRQLWSAQNFTDWQKGMIELARGAAEGTFGAAILSGYAPSGSGMSLDISAGIAFGPTGYLSVINEVSPIGSISAPTGNLERALIVIRPNLVNSDYSSIPPLITTPVPLKQLQESVVAIIRGNQSATPAYPATQANDIVVCGLRLFPGQTALAEEDFDFEVRDIPGKNSNFQQDQGKYDDRLRPYAVSSAVLGILPSQLEPPLARVFSYVNKTSPSIFPKSLTGTYNGAAGETLLNFTTGAITGADAASPNFTPQIPGAGFARVAVVALKSDDTIAVAYGAQGTRAQCLAGIKNQATAGAGSVVYPDAAKVLAFVIVYSGNGTAITELDFLDARGAIGTSAPAAGLGGGGTTIPGGSPMVLTDANDGEVILVDTSVAQVIVLPTPVEGTKVTIKDSTGHAHVNNITVQRFAAEMIEGLAASYTCRSSFGVWTFITDGFNWYLIA